MSFVEMIQKLYFAADKNFLPFPVAPLQSPTSGQKLAVSIACAHLARNIGGNKPPASSALIATATGLSELRYSSNWGY